MDESQGYHIAQGQGRWSVCSAAGNVVLECADAHSAEHYLELLNKAYRAGYKAGYRHAREADRERVR